MDTLLELLEKYNCHLKRGKQSMANYLSSNFQSYILDVKQAINASDNPLCGPEMCNMVSRNIDEIENNALKLIEVLQLYNNGKIVEAALNAFEVFDIMKSQLLLRYSGAYKKERYYRIRTIDETPFRLDRKELFHIPFNKNYLVGTERYSMPGHPCLYLASQPELAWYECGNPKRFALAQFSIPQEEVNHLKLIDFSEKLIPLKSSFIGWFNNEKDSLPLKKYLLKYIYTYPLRASCSVIVEHSKANFKEEYIISQFLLQWIRNDEDFDGIRYESCCSSDDVQSFGGHNIVLVTKQFDADGFDINLRDCIKIGSPKEYDLSLFNYDEQFRTIDKSDSSNNPFLWGMESVSDDFKSI